MWLCPSMGVPKYCGPSDCSLVAAVHVFEFEAELSVNTVGGVIIGLHIENCVTEMLSAQPCQTGKYQLATDTLAVEGRVHGDDIYLAQLWDGVVVDLGPAEAPDTTVSFPDPETLPVVPGFGSPSPEVLRFPVALFRVPMESPVVDLKEAFLVVVGECAGGKVGVQGG